MKPLLFLIAFLPSALAVGQRVPIWSVSQEIEDVFSVTFSPDDTQLASGSLGSVFLWDVSTGREIRRFVGHTSWVTSVAFSPDGTQLASGSDGGEIFLWDVSTGREIRRFVGQPGHIYAMAFSLDGTQLATGSSDRSINLWDVSTGSRISRFFGNHLGPVNSVAFSPDGTQQLASGSGEVHLWDISTRREIYEFFGHVDWVFSVAFSPDGNWIASGSSDVHLWDLTTQNEIRLFTGHTERVRAVVFSPDGSQLASGSEDHTVRTWDVISGLELTRLDHGSAVKSVDVSSQGRFLASGGLGEFKIKLWDATAALEFAGGIEDQEYTLARSITPLVLPKATAGFASVTYGLTPALPTGLSFDASARTIKGTPAEVLPIPLEYTYMATDISGATASISFNINVRDSASISFSTSIPDQRYARHAPIDPLVLPEATGGFHPINYTLSPILPEGLDFDASTRTVSGTPTEATSTLVKYT